MDNSQSRKPKMTRKKQRANAKRMKAIKRRKKSVRKKPPCKPTHNNRTLVQKRSTNPVVIAIESIPGDLRSKSNSQSWPNCIRWGEEADPLKTIKDARKRHLKFSKKTRQSVEVALAKLTQNEDAREEMNKLLCTRKFGGVSRASDITYRYFLGKFGIKILYKAIIKHASKVDLRQIYLITIIGDEMLSSELAPELDVYSIHETTAKLLRDTPGLNAFGVIELQACHNHSMSGGSDATLMGNIHIIAYGTDFDDEDFKKRADNKFSTTLAKRVTDVQCLGATDNDALRTVSYLFKMPRKSKSRKVYNDNGVQKGRHDRERDMRPDLLLRHYEILSSIPARGLLIGVRDGLIVKRKILNRMRKFERSKRINPKNKVSYKMVGECWNSFWESTKRQDYLEPTIRISRKKGGDNV